MKKNKPITKKFEILIEYTTGDSFHTEDTSRTLEHQWEKEEVALENLNRINDHYKWISNKNSYFPLEKYEEPEWHKKLPNDESIILLMDDGSEWQFWAFWCGYFESLISVEIQCNNYKVKF